MFAFPNRWTNLISSLTSDALVFLDADDRVQEASPRYREWTGLDPVGLPVAGLWEGPHWDEWRASVRLQGGGIHQEVFELKTASGDPLPVEVRLVPLAPRWGRGPLALLNLHDLREKRHLERLVALDPLSGVLSRPEIVARLDDELIRCRRYSWPLGLVLMDVDGFGNLNLLGGITFGDQVLRVVGAEAREVLGSADAAGRTGSDEFLLLLPQASARQVEEAAQRLGSSLAARLFAGGGEEITVTASFAVTVVRAESATSSTQLLGRLTSTLEKARSRGSGRVEFLS